MVNKIKQILKHKRIRIPRTAVLALVFSIMFFVLIHRLFELQIVQGEEYTSDFTSRTTKTRTIKSSRGNIFDCNGKLLASSKLCYSLTIEDNGTYDSDREKNLTLNSVAYRICKILEANGDRVDQNFHIVMNNQGEYHFDLEEGVNLERFRADIYGRALIDDLEKDEKNATAQQMMEYLVGPERFAISVSGEDAYSKEELAQYELPEQFTADELMSITIIRYLLSTNSFQKYMPATIATDLSDESVAVIAENKDTLQGVDIVEDSLRVYEDPIYFANIVGYTGQASSEELEELQKENPQKYDTTSVIGKSGIEQYMETDLQGTDGKETVYVDNLGKVLKIDEDSRLSPIAGHDVYLTIDSDLQIACYKILEQQIAGILLSHIVPDKTFDKAKISDTMQISVPIYDVYNALIENNVIDIEHFAAVDAAETEKSLYASFQQKQSEVFDRIKNELTGDNPRAYKDLDKELQEYLDYLVDDLLPIQLEVMDSDAIDTTDPTYQAWAKEETISLQEYLTYATRQNWIDISRISPQGDYLDSKEVYLELANYLTNYLMTDVSFGKLLYKYMLLNDDIDPRDLCIALYDQGILDSEDGMRESLAQGQTGAYEFITAKISSLEITPGQLALDPCSGSIVVSDPNTGQVRACVTYPGYDNNRLANVMDVDYYNKVASDLSQPFFNKATQQQTAPGSTFKMVSAIAGMESGIVEGSTGINCTGSFEEVEPHIDCWNTAGHGVIDLETALEQSCNYYFNEIGYVLGMDDNRKFSENLSLQNLKKYASMLGLDKPSGVEISEAEPQVSDHLAVPSYMGQGTHLYTTAGLARYVGTIATSGQSYKLSLIQKITDSQQKPLQEFQPKLENSAELPQSTWDTVHNGMRRVIQNHSQFNFDDAGVDINGKTGTAQENQYRPDHGVFVGYAPAQQPEVAVAVRIPYGYSSGNACLVSSNVFQYLFNEKKREKIITGVASDTSSNTSND